MRNGHSLHRSHSDESLVHAGKPFEALICTAYYYCSHTLRLQSAEAASHHSRPRNCNLHLRSRRPRLSWDHFCLFSLLLKWVSVPLMNIHPPSSLSPFSPPQSVRKIH